MSIVKKVRLDRRRLWMRHHATTFAVGTGGGAISLAGLWLGAEMWCLGTGSVTLLGLAFTHVMMGNWRKREEEWMVTDDGLEQVLTRFKREREREGEEKEERSRRATPCAGLSRSRPSLTPVLLSLSLSLSLSPSLYSRQIFRRTQDSVATSDDSVMLWERVRPRLRRALEALSPSIPAVSSSELAAIEYVIEEEVPRLRRQSAPTKAAGAALSQG